MPEGLVLFHQGDAPNGLYIVQSGILRATYDFAQYTSPIEESMVPGTIAGELSMLSELPRNATVVVERQAVLWKLSREALSLLQEEQPELARAFVQLVLKSKLSEFSQKHFTLTMPCTHSHEDR